MKSSPDRRIFGVYPVKREFKDYGFYCLLWTTQVPADLHLGRQNPYGV